jgi:NADH:ubiquinone oxidoreductase subunit K
MSEGNIEKGFTPIRTVRLVSAVVAVAGMFCLLVQRILSIAMTMAQEILDLAFARYGNFTGRFAAQNFAEDKKLLSMLNELKGLIPTVETALTLLLVLSVVLFVIALVGLALPRQSGHVLVALKLLKWQPVDGEDDSDDEQLAFSPASLKKLGIAAGVIVAIALAVFGIRGCMLVSSAQEQGLALQELDTQVQGYMTTQRAYFSKNKSFGTARQLGLDTLVNGDYYTFRVGRGYIAAESKVALEKCPMGTRWRVNAKAEGFISKELKFFSVLPKNRECFKFAPNLKNTPR